jgi:hypothetical protein
MDAFIPIETHVHCNAYSNHPERVEPIFKLSIAIPDGDYTMATVHAQAGAPITTLYPWPEQICFDLQ